MNEGTEDCDMLLLSLRKTFPTTSDLVVIRVIVCRDVVLWKI